VAEAAGVSVSTASRALAGKAKAYRISDRTAANIQTVADSLGYRPSYLARSLRLRRSGLIGVVVPDVANPFFAAIAREITLLVEASGYSVLLADSRDDTAIEKRLAQQLADRQVEGLIVCPVGLEPEHLLAIQSSGIPLVLVDRVFPGHDLVTVTSRHRSGAEASAKLLMAKGHRTIGVLQGIPGTLPNEERLAGLRSVLADHGHALEPELIAGENFTEKSGYEAAKELLSTRSDITALFAISTPNALGGLRAARELGWSIPDRLSLVAFDDHPFGDFMAVPLTTVSQDVRALGTTAAEILMTHLETKSRPDQSEHLIDTSLTLRQSIDACS
ncbi:MAG: LacI family DNA-binding transcriptional regulator, partial [Planctomycetota bacterium]